MKIKIQKPRGTKDILPDDQKYWQYVYNIIDKRCRAFGFGKIETPIFESKDLYVRSIGESTDIVDKEMFEVSQANKLVPNDERETDNLVLRPEYTAGIVRAYLENGMQSWPQPVKLYSAGPVFRYDRPQKGRFRQFTQFNLEIIGDANPLTDSLLMLLIWQIFKDLGLESNVVFDINSVGCKECRPKIKKKIVEYYKNYSRVICFDCQKRINFNPLRLLDCKNEQCQQIAQGSPQIVDSLCEECKLSFMKVLEYLEEMSIPYNLNPKLVRGLDYYTKTAFELRDLSDTKRQSSLGGGGRYDSLIETYGGPATPAIGFAAGIERIIDKIKELEIKVPDIQGAEVCIIQLGDMARNKALDLLNSLDKRGISATCIFGKESLKAQLKYANKMKAKIAIIIGQRESLDKTVIVKDMDESTQETIDIDDLEKFLAKKLLHV